MSVNAGDLSGQSLLGATPNGGSGPLHRRYIVAYEMAAGKSFRTVAHHIKLNPSDSVSISCLELL
jgi:hypothetical protein